MTLYLGDKVIASSNNFKTNIPYDLLESKYSDIEITNTSWVKSQGQKNSATIYPDVYNKVRQIGKSINEEHTEYDFVYDESDNTFILPTKNGSEDLPSDRYDNLTLGASGSTYIAPANGWFYSYGNTSATNGRVEWFKSNNFGDKSTNPLSGNSIRTNVFAQKGESFELYYANITPSIAFQYAQGNGDLYYYVGDTIKNSTLIDVAQVTSDLARKVDINSNVIDGQWVDGGYTQLLSTTSKTTHELDVSVYATSNCQYEFLLQSYAYSSNTATSRVQIWSDIINAPTDEESTSIHLINANSRLNSNMTLIPVGTGKKIYIRLSQSTFSQFGCRLVAYRRLGTNE